MAKFVIHPPSQRDSERCSQLDRVSSVISSLLCQEKSSFEITIDSMLSMLSLSQVSEFLLASNFTSSVEESQRRAITDFVVSSVPPYKDDISMHKPEMLFYQYLALSMGCSTGSIDDVLVSPFRQLNYIFSEIITPSQVYILPDSSPFFTGLFGIVGEQAELYGVYRDNCLQRASISLIRAGACVYNNIRGSF